jgi:hypothetical protein
MLKAAAPLFHVVVSWKLATGSFPSRLQLGWRVASSRLPHHVTLALWARVRCTVEQESVNTELWNFEELDRPDEGRDGHMRPRGYTG